jgi:hypothetical protein
MNFAFLEGGVAWAAALYCDIVGHLEKRNLQSLRRNLDPGLIDRELMMEMTARYAPGKQPVKGGFMRRPAEDDGTLDEWAACNIESVEDIKDLFVDRFWFGCEADDPMTSLAFNKSVNPSSAELQVMMGSDISHWDLPDVSEVLVEAYEMVEHGLMDESAFHAFTFTNPTKFYTGTNPDFFKGTAVESAVASYMREGLDA